MRSVGLSDKIFSIVVGSLVIMTFIIMVYPLLFVVSASFSDPVLVLAGKVGLFPKGFNIKSYVTVFQEPDVYTGYKNTIIYTTVGTAVNIIMTTLGAYPLSRKKFYGKNLFTAMLAFTMIFNGGLIPKYMVIKQLGLVNNFWVMIIPDAIQMWNLVIMRTFFQKNIPDEIYDAAMIDGCSNIRVLKSIVIPLSKSIFAVMVLFYAVSHWNSFFTALIYLTDERKYPLQIFLRRILIQNQYTEGLINTSGESAAERMFAAEGMKYSLIIISSLPILILYPFIQKYFVKGVMIGAIKG